jgi:hypothetical protein
MTAEDLAAVPAELLARFARVIAAQLDAGRRLAAEVAEGHRPGHTRHGGLYRVCAALRNAEVAGLWTPGEPNKDSENAS